MRARSNSTVRINLTSSRRGGRARLTPNSPKLNGSILVGALSRVRVSSTRGGLPFVTCVSGKCDTRKLIRLVHSDLPPREGSRTINVVLDGSPRCAHGLFSIVCNTGGPVAPRGGFVSSILYTLYISANANRPYGPKSAQRVVGRLVRLTFGRCNRGGPQLCHTSARRLISSTLRSSKLCRGRSTA